MSNKGRAALRLGPGLITGASNDDPSSVGTYSQVGAQFGYALAWTVLFSFPLLVAVQEISATASHPGQCRRRLPASPSPVTRAIRALISCTATSSGKLKSTVQASA